MKDTRPPAVPKPPRRRRDETDVSAGSPVVRRLREFHSYTSGGGLGWVQVAQPQR